MGIVVMLIALPAMAQQFSADLVRQKPAGLAPSKVMVSDAKLRFEAATAQAKTSVVVIDLNRRDGFIILPQAGSYTLLKTDRMSMAMPFFRPADADDACKAWETAVDKPKSCSKVGPETLNGRDTVKYTGVMHNGEAGTAWVDRKLKFVIKWEGEKTAADFENIQEGPQDASLFAAPKGYDKVDPEAERQKHSDAKTQKKPKPASTPKPQANN
jgi:hypothetical protein